MKKKWLSNYPINVGWVKILRIMKLTTLLIFLIVFSASASIYSQNAKISFKIVNGTLSEIFEEIEEQSDFRFFYQDEQILGVEKKTLYVDNQNIESIMSKLLEDSDISYRIEDRHVILFLKSNVNDIFKKTLELVSGGVKDPSGLPLPGVTVLIKGTTNGTITDADGNYSLSNVPEDAILQFSFIGMKTIEVPVAGKSVINATLAEETFGIEEVVAVGYGMQKKINLTGSISRVDAEELSEISVPTLAQAAMGKASGVFIKNVNGQPGDDTGIDINIRGFGSPLIIIDGLPATEWDFQQLDPNDIEDFNILKDASAAAVYGARAGNGVILVSTKRGKESEAKFTYTGNYGLQFFCVVPDFVSSAQFAEMENLAYMNEGKDPIWTDEQIQKFRDGSDPVNYPNTNWWDETLRTYAPQSQHNINVRGGNDKVKYFVSAGYFHQDGMLKSDDIDNDRYTLRSNLDVTLAKNFNVGVDISFTNQDYMGPRNQLERTGDVVGIMTMIYRSRPYNPNIPFPDPTKVPTTAHDDEHPTVLSEIDYVGYKKWTKLAGDAKLNFSYDLPYGFKVKAIFDFKRTYNRYKEKATKTPLYSYDWDTEEYNLQGYTNSISKLTEQIKINNNINQQFFLTWDKKFDDHEFNALFVYEKLSDNYDFLEATRQNYVFDLDYLFAGPDEDKSNDGYALETGRKAYIGRINYAYKGKYLLELSSRYDASPYFPEDTRWGFFPSASLGWRISEEPFIKDNWTFMDNLKLRVSHGKLGYDYSDDDDFEKYQYLSTYSIGATSKYIYNGADNILLRGIRTDALPNYAITWEKMYTTNAGFDFSMWNNKLEGSFDYFYRKRTDVLAERDQSIPDVVGAEMPNENYAEYDNRGWEAMLTHRNKIGEVSYSIGGNISWNREKCLYIDQENFTTMEAYRTGNIVGEWTDLWWRYPTDGLFKSMDEILGWADIDGKNNATIRPGDVKYIDTNGDGRISEEDFVILGRGKYPRFTYGLNMSASWKGFDFSMLWQGAGLYNFDLSRSPDLTWPFYSGDTPIMAMYNDAYVPENPWIKTNTDLNARFPMYRTDSYNRTHKNNWASQYWLVNGAYIRLKNIQLAYNLPEKLINRWGIDKCKVYVSGYNVLTFSELDFLDPEVDTDAEKTFGDYYPPVGTYNLGLILQF